MSSQNLYVEILIPTVVIFRSGGAFERGLGNEGRALINGFSALIKESPERFLDLSTMQGQQQKDGCSLKNGRFSPDTELAATLVLVLQPFSQPFLTETETGTER